MFEKSSWPFLKKAQGKIQNANAARQRVYSYGKSKEKVSKLDLNDQRTISEDIHGHFGKKSCGVL
jgi:hypothetical protein